MENKKNEHSKTFNEIHSNDHSTRHHFYWAGFNDVTPAERSLLEVLHTNLHQQPLQIKTS